MSAAPRCPTCKGPRKPAKENAFFPFCSKRCKLADLSNWLNERYVVPDESSAPEPAEDEEKGKSRTLN